MHFHSTAITKGKHLRCITNFIRDIVSIAVKIMERLLRTEFGIIGNTIQSSIRMFVKRAAIQCRGINSI